MFTVRSPQMSALGLPAFEREMVMHVGQYFPERFIMMGEPAAMETVRAAIHQGASHGIVLKRDVCLYLTCMLALGSHFDRDPKYAWALAILNGEEIGDASQRMTRLKEHMLEHVKVFPAHVDEGMVQRLTEVESLAAGSAARKGADNAAAIMEHLSTNYPEELACFRPQDVLAMAELGMGKAAKHEFITAGDRFSFTTLLFLLGAGCDADPQFPWIPDTLGQPRSAGIDARISLLLRNTITRMERSIAQTRMSLT
jgi:hypothetical protein